MPSLSIITAALATASVTVLGVGVGVASAGSGGDRVAEPPRPTIIQVEGDKANGFGIYYADGSSIFPPTDSEASAECGEYDRFRERVRCRVEVRIWYRDLGDLKRALAYAHAQ